MALRIEDYALVGDCQTAALVGLDGSIDWLCLPRFDSGACFAALLGGPEHGRWLIAPRGALKRATRAYRNGTLVLDTTFETEDGAVVVTDCMPQRESVPHLVRLVRGLRGRVTLRMELVVRFDYGSVVPWVRSIERGILAVAGNQRQHLIAIDHGAVFVAEQNTVRVTVEGDPEIGFLAHHQFAQFLGMK